MAGEPLATVNVGDPLEIQADTWNLLMDAARNDRKRRLGPQGGGFQINSPVPNCTVLVQNTTGDDVDRFDPLCIEHALILPNDQLDEWKNDAAFKGISPAAGKVLVILQEPLAKGSVGDPTNGAIGLAVLLGRTPAYVTVTDDAHNFARINENGDLVSDAFGERMIRESGTGEQWVDLVLTQRSRGAVVVRLNDTAKTDGLYSGNLLATDDGTANVVASSCWIGEASAKDLARFFNDGTTPVDYPGLIVSYKDDGLPIVQVRWNENTARDTLDGNTNDLPAVTPAKILVLDSDDNIGTIEVTACDDPAYTDADAQAAVGGILTNTPSVTLTYNAGVLSISAAVNENWLFAMSIMLGNT